MATAKLVFEIYALTPIPEQADVGDGSGDKQGTSETPPKPLRQMEGYQAAFTALEGFYRWHVKWKSDRLSKELAKSRTSP